MNLREPEFVARLAQLDHFGLDEITRDDERRLRLAVRRLDRHENGAVEPGRDEQPRKASARTAPYAVSSSCHVYSSGSVTIPSLSTPACLTAAMTLTTSPYGRSLSACR